METDSHFRLVPDRAIRIGRFARVALAGTGVIIRRFGEEPPTDNAAVYGLRMFGVRTVVLGIDLVTLTGDSLRRALGQAVIIHGTDTATAAWLGFSGRVKP